MTPAVVPSWINKGQPRGEWPAWLVEHAATKPEPNGSFLVRTKLGQSRVHMRSMVFEWQDHAYVCDPSEAKAKLAELEAAAAPTPPAYVTNTRIAAEAPVADRADDTDDISRRIRGEEIPAAPPPPNAPPPPAPKQRSKWPEPVGRMPTIQNCSPAELLIDDSYQRSIDTGPSQALIKRIALGWDWRMCLPLVVSHRIDGSLYVIDGQHRLAAAQMRKDIPWLPCCVGVYSGIEDEAAMFVQMNRARRAMNRLDDFHAAQAGADPDARAIADIIESVGFTVSRRTGSAAWIPGEVAFTSAIAGVRRKHGDEMARRALQMMADTFPGERLVAGSSIFSAICRLVVAPPDGFKLDLLPKALATFDMKGWASFLGGSRGGDDRAQKLRAMLLEAYADVERARAE